MLAYCALNKNFKMFFLRHHNSQQNNTQQNDTQYNNK